MTDIERLEQRLSAVERTVVDGDHDLEDLEKAAELADELGDVAARVDEFEHRLAELEADVQALGGYASEVEAVNEDVQKQAYSTYAAVDRLEDQLESLEGRLDAVEAADARSAAGEDAAETSGDDAADDTPSDERSSGDDSDDGDLGPFEPASSLEGGSDGDSSDASPGTATPGPDAVESDGGNARSTAHSADQDAVDALFEDDSGSSRDGDGSGGFLASLRAKFS